MNEFAKTGAMAGVAVVLTLLAVMMKPGEARLSLFDDQGEAFFPGFTDGAAIAELELTAFRPESSSVYAFIVKRDEKGVWTIPSHGNYPADANDQMGKAAAMLIGLKKDSIVGDAKGRHAEYDLIDPFAEGVETKGRGKRLKLKDSAGNVLADLISGREIEGKDDDGVAKARDQWEEAIKLESDKCRGDPERSEENLSFYHKNLGLALYHQGDMENALGQYELAIGKNAMNADNYFNRGNVKLN